MKPEFDKYGKLSNWDAYTDWLRIALGAGDSTVCTYYGHDGRSAEIHFRNMNIIVGPSGLFALYYGSSPASVRYGTTDIRNLPIVEIAEDILARNPLRNN